MLQKPKNQTWLFAAAALLLAPIFSVNAAEVTARETITDDYKSSFNESIEDMFDELDNRLAIARFQREEGDRLIREDLNTAVTQFTNRLNTIESQINTIDNRFEEVKAILRADIDTTRASLRQLEIDLEGNVNYLLSRVTQTYGYINTTVNQLQSQITTQEASITDLNTRANQILERIVAMEAFANSIRSQMESLATCVANASCLTRANIGVQRQTFTIYTGEAIAAGQASRTVCWSWFLWWCTSEGLEYYTIYAYGTKNLGVYYPTWHYCAITGAQNQDVRNFHIYLSGSQWTLRNETKEQSGWAGQEGYVFATCLRFT